MNTDNPDIVPQDYEWQPFTEAFDYVKEFYDVRLVDGTVVKHCWPNAGFMNALNGDGRKFSAADNVYVKLSTDHPEDDCVTVVASRAMGKTPTSPMKLAVIGGGFKSDEMAIAVAREAERGSKVVVVDDVGVHTPSLRPDLMIAHPPCEHTEHIFKMYNDDEIEKVVDAQLKLENDGMPPLNPVVPSRRNGMMRNAATSAALLGLASMGINPFGRGGWDLDFGRFLGGGGSHYEPKEPSPELDSANKKIAEAGGQVAADRIRKREEKLARRKMREEIRTLDKK